MKGIRCTVGADAGVEGEQVLPHRSSAAKERHSTEEDIEAHAQELFTSPLQVLEALLCSDAMRLIIGANRHNYELTAAPEVLPSPPYQLWVA